LEERDYDNSKLGYFIVVGIKIEKVSFEIFMVRDVIGRGIMVMFTIFQFIYLYITVFQDVVRPT